MHREYHPEEMGLVHVQGADHDHHHHDHDHPPHDHNAERRALIAATLVVGVLLGADLLLAALGLNEYRRPFGVSLSLLAAIIGGGRVIFLALSALLEGRVGADIALAIACIAAGLAGEFFVAAEVVFIALVGECLEAFTFERARGAIQKLLEYRPRTARVLRDGEEVEVPAESVAVGDIVVVRPGERIAADGTVRAGRSAVDQAILTGESMPVDKGPGDGVFTGTINRFGRLEVVAERVGAESAMGQVIRLLAEAQRNKAPLERAADRYARLFLPAVLIAATAVFLLTNASALWGWRSSGRFPALDVMPALAVLVVACPCALVLATPAAVLAATARLARRGVLIKGGVTLERLAKVDALAFDKTGTLTEGRPELADRVALSTWTEADLLRLAAAAESSSEHPLARLLVSEARATGIDLPASESFQAQPGAGIVAKVERRSVLVGNLRLVRERGVEVPAEAEEAIKRLDDAGQTVLIVAVDGQVAGILGARDRVRREAHDVIHDLKHLGLKDITILTGDRPAAANSVGKKVHVKSVESELTPADKAEWVQRRQHEGRTVAMVGDGINDAPALAMADVGLALGGAGTDIAAEAGNVILMGDPLAPLPEAIRLARQSVAIIRQNILLFAFGLNALAVVLAGLRVLGPVAAAIFHQIGSLLVLLNAMRLLGFERWGALPGARLVAACARCRPSSVLRWASAHRGRLALGFGVLALVGYVGSGVTLVEPGEVGVLRRFGRFVPPLLEPGLHWRWPAPVETVTKDEPIRVRTARVGLAASGPTPSGPVAWNTSHARTRDAEALYFTGDENLVELSGVVEYRDTPEGVADRFFGVVDLDAVVAAAAEASFREVVGMRGLDELLVADRGGIEESIRRQLTDRLADSGLHVEVEGVRIVDAHPPREVVPAYRDVSAAVSDAARFRNDAEAYAGERAEIAEAEAQETRDGAAIASHALRRRVEGQSGAFLARQSAHAASPALTEFRLLHEAMAVSLADRPKLLLDPRAGGRRHVWLADPERFGLGAGATPPLLAEPVVEPEE